MGELRDRSPRQRSLRLRPGEKGIVEELARLPRQLRQDRSEIDDEGAEEVQRDGAGVLQLARFRWILAQLPGGFFLDVGIGLIGQLHDHPHRLAEVAVLIGSPDFLTAIGETLEEPAIVGIIDGKAGLGDKFCGAAREVHDLADEVAVHPRDEFTQVQIEVLHLRGEFCRVVVAQVFRFEVLEVFRSADEGAARFRHFLAVHGEEAVNVHLGGQAEARRLQFRRPEEGMEILNVLADEVVDLCLLALPPVVECFTLTFAPFRRRADVADRRVEPHIPVVAGRVGNFEAEVGGRAGDVPVTERLVEEEIFQVVRALGRDRAGLGPLGEEVVHLFDAHEEVFRRADLWPRP